MAIQRIEFEDVEAILQAAKAKGFVNEGNRSLADDSFKSPMATWYGLEAKEAGPGAVPDVIGLTRKGWDRGAQRIREVADKLDVGPAISVRRRNVWTDDGSHLEMDRVWAGQIDVAWRRAKRTQSRGPMTIRLVADVAGNCHLDAEDMFWRGACVVAVAERLVEAGHNVEIIAGAYLRAQSGGQKILMTTVTKAATAPMDIGAIAATTALPGFFRGIGLQVLWRTYETTEYGCGSSETMTEKKIDKTNCDKAFLVTNSVSTQDAAEKRASEIIAICNGEAVDQPETEDA